MSRLTDPALCSKMTLHESEFVINDDGQAKALCKLDNLNCLRQSLGERFFTDHMAAALKKRKKAGAVRTRNEPARSSAYMRSIFAGIFMMRSL